MTNKNDDRRFLEAQLQWVKQQDALLEQIESKLYEMKHIAEKVASNNELMPENEKHRLNEKFTHLMIKVTELENQLHTSFN